MKAILTSETINILGGQQNVCSDLGKKTHSEDGNSEKRFGKFRNIIKRVWNGILNVAEDIKEKIIPVVEPTIKAIAGFITSIAVLRNSRRKYAAERAS